METRKVITILFADLMGSTALQEQLDPESVNSIMDAYYRLVRIKVEAAGGTVVQLLGDGMFCAFGIPAIAEDDALRAVRAAYDVQLAFREFLELQRPVTATIGLRIAVNTGEVVVSDEHPAGIGDPLNVAARLQQEAQEGEVLIGQATRRLVADAVTLERAGVFKLKGRSEPVTAYRLLSLDRPAGRTASFVGRDAELGRLTAVFEQAAEHHAARLGVLVGSPGLGKSRLIDELTRHLGERASIITAHCEAAGGATFAPMAQAFREWLGAASPLNSSVIQMDPDAHLRTAIETGVAIEDNESARVIAGLMALLRGLPSSPEETFFVIRRFLSALAAERPVVLVIDDLHWAEPLLLDLIEHLIQWGAGTALFVLIAARPELRERRSSLVTPGGVVTDVVTLEGLDANAAMRLAASVIGAADLPATVAARVLATSEGNPLFVGELIRMLVDEGAIEKQGDRWVIGANLARLEMPPTIHALLAARLDRLSSEASLLLERASVVGRHFSRGAVAALLGEPASALDTRLEVLKRSELIESDTGWLLGEPTLRFHHVLIRDAAYRRLLKGTRAELHEACANWIEAQAGSAPEQDESIGGHLEQANLLLGEIGPVDARRRTLGRRAAERLSAAGRRALARDDVGAAADLLGRAVRQLDPASASRAELTLDWCEALLSAGDVSHAAEAIESLASTNDPRLRAWWTCFSSQLSVLTEPDGLQDAAESVALAAAEFTRLGDAGGQAKAHFVHAQALARLGKVGACESALDLALAAARMADDRRRANTVLALAPMAALWGPSPVTRASGRCLDVVRVLRISQGAPAVEAVALSCQGVLEALRGRTDAAHRMIAAGRRMAEELGIAQRLHETDVHAGYVTLLEGNPAAAEETLRGAYEGLRQLGLGIDAARAAALLARAVLEQGRIAEAEALSEASESLAGDDLKAAIAWRGVRAEALARRGEVAAALRFAKAAVDIAATTDALLDHADARRALAVALRAADRPLEADSEDERANGFWMAKGASFLIGGAHAEQGPTQNARVPDGSLQRHADAGSAPLPGPPALRDRSVRPNDATRLCTVFADAVNSRDMAVIRSLINDDLHFEHRPTGSVYGAAGFIQTWRGILKTRELAYSLELLASLGSHVSLHRHVLTMDQLHKPLIEGAGSSEVEELVVMQTDADGRACRMALFAANRLGDALVSLLEHHANTLPEGPARSRTLGFARLLAAHDGPVLPARIAAVLDPAFRCIDHRVFGTWNTNSAEGMVEHFRMQLVLAPDFSGRFDDVCVIEPDIAALRTTFSGTAAGSGGAFVNTMNLVFTSTEDGRCHTIEAFETDQYSETLARVSALVSARRDPEKRGTGESAAAGSGTDQQWAAQASLFTNRATRAVERGAAALAARDWQAFAALMAPGFRHFDRTRVAQLELEGQDWLASFRQTVEMTSAPPTYAVLGTRGEYLALMAMTWRGAAGDIGPSEIEWRLVIEVNERGEHLAIVAYDPEDTTAAYAELDERFLAGNEVRQRPDVQTAIDFTRHVAARDWASVATLCAPEFVEFDHRALATLGTTRGGEGWAKNFGQLVALAPDAIYRIHHLRTVAHGVYSHGSWIGTREGGPWEIIVNAVLESDDTGQLIRADIYDSGDVAAPYRRLQELAARKQSADRTDERLHQRQAATASPLRTGLNVSTPTRAINAWAAAYRAGYATGDWSLMRTTCSPGFRFSDRRRMSLLDGDAELLLASSRARAETGFSQFEYRPLRSAGPRVEIGHVFWSGGPDEGRFEIEYIAVVECDDDGRLDTMVFFDLEDRIAAHDEALRRQSITEPAVAEVLGFLIDFRNAFNARDTGALGALCHDKLVYIDHRRTGAGRIESPEAAIAAISMYWTLTESQHAEYGWNLTALSQHAALATVRRAGTLKDGGAFESEYLELFVVRANRATHLELFELDDFDHALARFAALQPAATG